MAQDPSADIAKRIEAIEEGYEFMLAYAAQGRDTDEGAKSSPGIRDFLGRMEGALEGMGAAAKAYVQARNPESLAPSAAFLDAIDDDASKAQGAVRLVLAQRGISSQLIDNLNASIHLRALLTDLFVIDEALKRHAPAS
jgi:hypothetical protein